MAAATERGAPLGPYVDFLMREWRITEASRRVQLCVSRVLKELQGEVLQSLRREPKLEVVVLPTAVFSIWAYFPMHRRRTIARHLGVIPKPSTRILLVVDQTALEKQPLRKSQDELRDHLGHTLLYLPVPRLRTTVPMLRGNGEPPSANRHPAERGRRSEHT